MKRLIWRALATCTFLASSLISTNPTVLAHSPIHSLESQALALAAGLGHTCALTDSGGVLCWGQNAHGQLGDGTTTDRSTPVPVAGLTSGASALAAGEAHTCALTSSGGVLCWGQNSTGQLGDGTLADRSTPVLVFGLTSSITALAAGGGHTCALTASGGVTCWGENSHGQLGDGTTLDRHTPVEVIGLASGVLALAAGGGHTCALTDTGKVLCWGANLLGQLGDGTTLDRSTPVEVTGLASGVLALAAGGGHTCILTDTGGVLCWGENASGQLGQAAASFQLTPVEVTGLAGGVKALSAGSEHTCVVTASGGVKCLGWNFYGQLGDGTTLDRSLPTQVAGLNGGVKTVAAGGDHTCALLASGDVRCWGATDLGQLGDGDTTIKRTPVNTAGLYYGISALSAGDDHTCALTSAGGVKCWGWNAAGQLGDGSTLEHSTPVEVVGLSSSVKAVTGGGYHTCALTVSGGVMCWGGNHGQLGDGTRTNRSTPVEVVGLSSGVIALSAGFEHTCAVTASGGVKCWGVNDLGQLGDGTTTDRNTPVEVVGLSSGVVAIATGGRHTCALTVSGGVKCWGWNYYGELGDGTFIGRSIPVDVSGLASEVTVLAAGFFHTCALTTSGEVWCWGSNTNGQLGDGTNTNSNVPLEVSGLPGGMASLAAGMNFTCAATNAGGAWCWGVNVDGELGDGSQAFARSTPAEVTGLSGGATALAAGGYHACSLTASGGVQCWGSNTYGQLGYKVLWVPVNVTGFAGGYPAHRVYLPLAR